MKGAIQLSILVLAIARHSVSDTLGCLSHICMTHRWWIPTMTWESLLHMTLHASMS